MPFRTKEQPVHAPRFHIVDARELPVFVQPTLRGVHLQEMTGEGGSIGYRITFADRSGRPLSGERDTLVIEPSDDIATKNRKARLVYARAAMACEESFASVDKLDAFLRQQLGLKLPLHMIKAG